ncbi:hypothetical protein RND81_03G199400 [Saponaria officinalis]|uniref:Myeloid leukemia factor 1 n=1 Tax=Saponaria officinalis TaxID=3572 RepID=A0AAW1M9Z7_SAPOF
MQDNRGQDQRTEFGDFGNLGGFGGSIFGRNPFDDPFFTTRPFGSILNQRNRVGESHSIIPPVGPVIQELSSDDDEDNSNDGRESEGEEAPKSTRPSMAPFVNHPDDETDDDQKDTNCRTDYNKVQGNQPQTFKVSTCKVTYGGIDGVYYSSSSTRRMGSDGVIVEECKEADKSKGEATHRISRGLHDKGHSVTRKLNPDGKVDTLQTLHNLNEDELGSFEEAWRSNNGGHLPPWTGPRGSSMGRTPGSFLLPPTRHMEDSTDNGPQNETRANPSGGRSKKVVRIPIE